MFKTKGFYKIALRWRSQISENVNKGVDRILYEREKNKEEDLKEFIQEEMSKGTDIFLDFLINEIDLGFWLNTNYFLKRIIGIDYKNTIAYPYRYNTEVDFDKINFTYQKIILKRILGQLIDRNDCIDDLNLKETDYTLEELENSVIYTLNLENQDTMLYCSGCCGDRACGYFGMRVYQTDKSVIWQMRLYGIIKFEFDKTDYFNAFEEYTNFINTELIKRGFNPVKVNDDAEKYLDNL